MMGLITDELRQPPYTIMNTIHRVRPLLVLALGFLLDSSLAAVGAELPRGLMIVAPERLLPSLSDFVTYKQTLLPTTVHSLEKILAENAGADDPEKLKQCIYRKWKDEHVGYVLLVGDVDVLPVRYMVLDRVTPAAFNYAFYPSDLYYSDLAKADGSFDDWNGRRDDFHARYYGEVRGEANKEDRINFDGVDYLPDVAVGRWPVNKEEEARAIAGKTMAYEQQVIAGTAPQLHRAALLGVDGWVDTQDLLAKLETQLGEGWAVEKYWLSVKSSEDKRAVIRQNHEKITELFNRGLGLVVHTGHGQPDQWEQCFSAADLEKLTNEAATPIVVSAGCSTAHFAPLPPYETYVDVDGREHAGSDKGEKFTEPPPSANPYQRGRFNPTCLGEQILKRPTSGGVAYIGCNTGSQPFALALVEGFVKELGKEAAPRLGDCWSGAIRHYVKAYALPELKPTESWTPPSIFFQGMKFMVFGDPSLRLPGKQRATASVDLRPIFEKWGLTVRSQRGRPTCSVFTVAGALEFAASQKLQRTQRLSVEYLNWASNDVVGRAQDGGFFSDLWKGFDRHGICPEEAMPYAEKFKRSNAPGDPAIESAKEITALGLRLHWIKEWNVQTGLTEEQTNSIRKTIASGWPVCGGFRWPKKEQWKENVLQMCDAADVFDGHSVLLIGYKVDASFPGGGAFLIRNTNGTGSENWMPYAYAASFMNDAAWIGF
jgi:hypothetical protein